MKNLLAANRIGKNSATCYFAKKLVGINIISLNL